MSFYQRSGKMIQIARISGIPIRAGFGWFAALLLMTLVAAFSIGKLVNDIAISITLAFATACLFFISIFLHEFAHAVIAKMEGLRTVEIILHPFGGLTRFVTEPKTARAEFLIAFAGPAASFILALLFAVLAFVVNSSGLDILSTLLFLLAISNFLIAIFNLLPGYPLDGGRVLRAYLWRNGKDLDEATALTGRCGQVIAVVIIVLGLLAMAGRGQIFAGFWMIVTGIFLFDSARGLIRDVQNNDDRLVDDVMMLPAAVSPDITVQAFVDNVLSMHRQTVFPVAVGRKLLGILVIEDMKGVPREEWRKTTISDVMHNISENFTVETGTPFSEAKEILRRNGIGYVCVINDNGDLVGSLGPEKRQ